MSVRLDAFVVAVPGLEPLLLDEVQKLGVRPARIVRGGVECNITWPQLWSINLRSRVATRVLVRVAKFHADGFHSLQVGIKGIDWSDHGPYWRAGYQALMVTDTAPFRNPHYHEATDLPATMDFVRLARVTVGLEAVVRDLASPR